VTNPVLRTRNSGWSGSGYNIPTDMQNGKPRNVVGVTTVTSVVDKPTLRSYYADAVAAKAVVSIDALLNRTEEEGFRFLRYEGNYANKDAVQNGNVVHDWIDAHMTGGFEPELENAAQESMVAEFLSWRAENDVTVLCSESTFYNPTVGYAGTADWVWNVNGVVTLGDNKTGRNIYREAHQQLAALGACSVWLRQVPAGTEGAVSYENKEFGVTWWVEDAVPAFSEYAILHVRPPDFDVKGFPKDSFCELKKIEQWRIDLAWEGFLGAYALKKAEKDEAEFEKRLTKEVF
jgi:hypothetical protein